MTQHISSASSTVLHGLPLFDHLAERAEPISPAEAAVATRRSRGRVGYHSGLAAEDIVASRYLQSGHRLAQQRFRGVSGEIDLVFRYGDGVVFVEVKHSRSHDAAAQRLSRRQIERLCGSAAEFLGTEPKGQLTDARFDLALVDGRGAVRIIENAIMDGF